MNSNIANLCWICGQPATSREHLIKKSDLKLRLPGVSQQNPIFIQTKSKSNIPVGSLDNKRFKSDKILCQSCNTTLTQPYDRAWEKFSSFLHGSIKNNRRPRTINMARVIGQPYNEKATDLQLYMVKMLGTMMTQQRSNAPIDSLAKALLSREAHSSVFVRVGHWGDTRVLGAPMGTWETSTSQPFQGAVTFLELHDYSIQLIWNWGLKPLAAMNSAWHPAFARVVIPVLDFQESGKIQAGPS